MVATAIAKTEGGLTGIAGDKGQSFGPFQFFTGGQLGNFARALNTTMAEAAQVAVQDMDTAVLWALQPGGYLGDTIRKGQQQGLSGPELATYAQRYGQVSEDPARSGRNFTVLFGQGGNAPVMAADNDPLGGVPGLQGLDTGGIDLGGLDAGAGLSGGIPGQAGGSAPNGVPWAINNSTGGYITWTRKDGTLWQADQTGGWHQVGQAPSATAATGTSRAATPISRNSIGWVDASGQFHAVGGGTPGSPGLPNTVLNPGQTLVSGTGNPLASTPSMDPAQFGYLVQEAARQYQLSIEEAKRKWQQDRDTQGYRQATLDAENAYRTQLLGIQRAQLGAQVAISERQMGQPQVVPLQDGRTLILRPNQMVGGVSRDWEKLLGPTNALPTTNILGAAADHALPEVPGTQGELSAATTRPPTALPPGRGQQAPGFGFDPSHMGGAYPAGLPQTPAFQSLPDVGPQPAEPATGAAGGIAPWETGAPYPPSEGGATTGTAPWETTATPYAPSGARSGGLSLPSLGDIAGALGNLNQPPFPGATDWLNNLAGGGQQQPSVTEDVAAAPSAEGNLPMTGIAPWETAANFGQPALPRPLDPWHRGQDIPQALSGVPGAVAGAANTPLPDWMRGKVDIGQYLQGIPGALGQGLEDLFNTGVPAGPPLQPSNEPMPWENWGWGGGGDVGSGQGDGELTPGTEPPPWHVDAWRRAEPFGTDDPTIGDPGASSDSPAYYMRQALEDKGWNDPSITWAIKNVPITYRTGELENKPNIGGIYSPEWQFRPDRGQTKVRLDTPYSRYPLSDDWGISETTAHEMQHAWEDQQLNERFPSQDDLERLFDEMGWDEMRQGTRAQVRQQDYYKDPAHRTHLLDFEMGMDPRGLPDWFRNKYFSEFGTPEDLAAQRAKWREQYPDEEYADDSTPGPREHEDAELGAGGAGQDGDYPSGTRDLEAIGAGPNLGQPMAPPPGGLVPPVPQDQIVGLGHDFGTQTEDETPFHKGVDFQAVQGVPVIAPVEGMVTSVGDRGDLGLSVTITDKTGQVHELNHLSQISVREGQEVMAGDLVGRVGSTGNSSGPHLDYRVRGMGDDFVDPMSNPAIAQSLQGLPDMSGQDLGQGAGDDLSNPDPLDFWWPRLLAASRQMGGVRGRGGPNAAMDLQRNYADYGPEQEYDRDRRGVLGTGAGEYVGKGAEVTDAGGGWYEEPSDSGWDSGGEPGWDVGGQYNEQTPEGGWQQVTVTDSGYDINPIDPSDYQAYGIPGDYSSGDGGYSSGDGGQPQQQMSAGYDINTDTSAQDWQSSENNFSSGQWSSGPGGSIRQRTQDLVNQGMDPNQAYRQASNEYTSAGGVIGGAPGGNGTDILAWDPAQFNAYADLQKTLRQMGYGAAMDQLKATIDAQRDMQIRGLDAQRDAQIRALDAQYQQLQLQATSAKERLQLQIQYYDRRDQIVQQTEYRKLEVAQSMQREHDANLAAMARDAQASAERIAGTQARASVLGTWGRTAGASPWLARLSGRVPNPGDIGAGVGYGTQSVGTQNLLEGNAQPGGSYADYVNLQQPGYSGGMQGWQGATSGGGDWQEVGEGAGENMELANQPPGSQTDQWGDATGGELPYGLFESGQHLFGSGQGESRQLPDPLEYGPNGWPAGWSAWGNRAPNRRPPPSWNILDLYPMREWNISPDRYGTGQGDVPETPGSGAGEHTLPEYNLTPDNPEWLWNMIAGATGGQGYSKMTPSGLKFNLDRMTLMHPGLIDEVGTGAGEYSPFGLNWGNDTSTAQQTSTPATQSGTQAASTTSTGGQMGGGFANNLTDLEQGGPMPTAPSLSDWQNLGPFGRTGLRYGLETAGYGWAPYAEAMTAGWRQTGQADPNTGLSGWGAPHVTALGMQSMNPMQNENLRENAELFGTWADYLNREARAWNTGVRNMSQIRA